MRFALAAVVALALWPAMARADKVDDLALVLRGDPDYKVRLSAALNLGKLGDRRAIAALVDGMTDLDRTVRSVCAGALGKLVDINVPPDERARVQNALEAASRTDPDSSVRAQAQKSLDFLQSLQPVVPPPVAKGVYIEVGAMADNTKRGAAILPIMRQQVLSSLGKRAPAYQTRWPSGHSPTELELKKIGTTAFFVDASLTQLTVNSSHVACAVSMILATYPQKSMFGFLKGNAEVDAGSSSERAVAEAQNDCVTAVLDDLVESKIVPTIKNRVP